MNKWTRGLFGIVGMLLFGSFSATAGLRSGMLQGTSVSDIDLARIILVPGDFPPGFTCTEQGDRAPEAYKALPISKKVVSVTISRGKEIAGGAVIFLYETDEEVGRAYSTLLQGFGKPVNKDYDLGYLRTDIRTVSGIGERASLAVLDAETVGYRFKFYELMFSRCRVLVSIRCGDFKVLREYAKKLDKRILSSLCGPD